MYDASKVIGGVVIFLGLVTAPAWYAQVSGKKNEMPTLDPGLPKIDLSSKEFEDFPKDLPLDSEGRPKECIEPKESIRANHMQILNEFRDKVVRENIRDYRSSTGRVFKHMKLTGTCLGCHTNKKEFCDKCHDYVGEKPYCFDCHLEKARVSER